MGAASLCFVILATPALRTEAYAGPASRRRRMQAGQCGSTLRGHRLHIQENHYVTYLLRLSGPKQTATLPACTIMGGGVGECSSVLRVWLTTLGMAACLFFSKRPRCPCTRGPAGRVRSERASRRLSGAKRARSPPTLGRASRQHPEASGTATRRGLAHAFPDGQTLRRRQAKQSAPAAGAAAGTV